MADRIDDIREKFNKIIEPVIPKEMQKYQNIFLFTSPEKKLTFNIKSDNLTKLKRKHFKLLEIHEASKFLKNALCEVLTGEVDDEIYIPDDHCFYWNKNIVEFIYPGDPKAYTPDTCWASHCEKRNPEVKTVCDRYSEHCYNSKPTCLHDQVIFIKPENDGGCQWECCNTIIESCISESAYDYDSSAAGATIDQCVKRKSLFACSFDENMRDDYSESENYGSDYFDTSMINETRSSLWASTQQIIAPTTARGTALTTSTTRTTTFITTSTTTSTTTTSTTTSSTIKTTSTTTSTTTTTTSTSTSTTTTKTLTTTTTTTKTTTTTTITTTTTTKTTTTLTSTSTTTITSNDCEYISVTGLQSLDFNGIYKIMTVEMMIAEVNRKDGKKMPDQIPGPVFKKGQHFLFPKVTPKGRLNIKRPKTTWILNDRLWEKQGNRLITHKLTDCPYKETVWYSKDVKTLERVKSSAKVEEVPKQTISTTYTTTTSSSTTKTISTNTTTTSTTTSTTSTTTTSITTATTKTTTTSTKTTSTLTTTTTTLTTSTKTTSATTPTTTTAITTECDSFLINGASTVIDGLYNRVSYPPGLQVPVTFKRLSRPYLLFEFKHPNGQLYWIHNSVKSMEGWNLIAYKKTECPTAVKNWYVPNGSGFQAVPGVKVEVVATQQSFMTDSRKPTFSDNLLNTISHSESSTWGEWSDCDASCCDCKGQRERSGKQMVVYQGHQTQSTRSEYKSCTKKCDNDQQISKPTAWSSWFSWSYCSTTCDVGTKKRQRCNENLRSQCETDSTDCITARCPTLTKWSSWSAWSNCSKTCGVGERTRKRCDENGSQCEPNSADCIEVKCPMMNSWGSWEKWSTCSVTCGPGTRTRNRCMNTRAGRNCSAQTGQCEKPSCLRTNLNRYNYNMNNINNYNRWSEWTACPCGGGKRSRTKGSHHEKGYCDRADYEQTQCEETKVNRRSGKSECSKPCADPNPGTKTIKVSCTTKSTCMQYGRTSTRSRSNTQTKQIRCNVAACGEDCNTMVNSCYRDIKLKTFQKPGPEEKCKKFEECIEYKSEACYDAYDKIRRYQILFMENC